MAPAAMVPQPMSCAGWIPFRVLVQVVQTPFLFSFRDGTTEDGHYMELGCCRTLLCGFFLGHTLHGLVPGGVV